MVAANAGTIAAAILAFTLLYPMEARPCATYHDIEDALSVTAPPICSWEPPPPSPLCIFQGSDLCKSAANKLTNPTPIAVADALVSEAISYAKKANATANALNRVGEEFVLANTGAYTAVIGYWEKGLQALHRRDFRAARDNFLATPNTIADAIDGYAVNCVKTAMYEKDVQLLAYARNSVGILLNDY